MSTESNTTGEGRPARPEKMAAVSEIAGRLTGSEVVVVSEYRGLSVSDLALLRTNLRPAGGKYKIYKNTLTRMAAARAEVGDEFTELLIGPTAITYTDAPTREGIDVVAIAKALKEFGAGHDKLVIKGGLFEGRFIDAAEVNRLADIEPREVLLAKLAGLMAAPMQQFAGLLQAVPRDFAGLLKALIDIGGAPGAPASAESPAADTPAESEDEVAPAEEASDETPEATTDESASADSAPANETNDDAADAESTTENQESE